MDKEERRKKLELRAKFNQRISIAKAARASFIAKNYVAAVKGYTSYLQVLCHAKGIEDIYELSPDHFDDETQVSELLLISNIYWELSRMYETVPNFREAYEKSLEQFVKFTANQPFQVLNSELVRKYLRRNSSSEKIDREAIKKAYDQIFVDSKSCFVASYAFGDQHSVTNDLRHFKTHLMSWPKGTSLVSTYYKYSPTFIKIVQLNKYTDKLARLTIVPILRIFAFFTQTSIFRGCSYLLKLLRNLGLNLFSAL